MATQDARESRGWLREPLLYFVVIGLVLFGLGEAWTSRAASDEERERVEVSAERVEWLSQSFESRWLRPPTEAELRGLVDDHVRREVLYREALGMGLDEGDEIVRRRLVQKMEFMTEDLALQVAPAEAELEAFLQENLEDYLVPELRRYEQVFFNLDRGDAAVEAAEELLSRLGAAPDAPADLAELGDRLLLPHEDGLQSETDVARLFGTAFAESLFALRRGEWSGPVASAFGLHVVRVTDVREGRAPALDEVRGAVVRDYMVQAKEAARDAIYSSLATGYDVVIDEEAIRSRSMRTAPAGEDP